MKWTILMIFLINFQVILGQNSTACNANFLCTEDFCSSSCAPKVSNFLKKRFIFKKKKKFQIHFLGLWGTGKYWMWWNLFRTVLQSQRFLLMLSKKMHQILARKWSMFYSNSCFATRNVWTSLKMWEVCR